MPAAESGGRFGLACPKKRAAAGNPPLILLNHHRRYCCGAGVLSLPLVAGRAEAWAVLLAARCCPRVCGWCEAVADAAEACCGAVLFVSCRPFCLEHNGQTVLSRICSSAVLIKKRCLKRHLRSAAATVKACTRFHSQELAILAKSRSSGASRAHQRPQAKIVAANLRTCRGAAPLPRSRATLRRSPGPRCAAQNLNIVRNCGRPVR